MCWRLAWLFAVLMLGAGGGAATQQPGFIIGVRDTLAIRTVDQDRLYLDSRFGRRVRATVIAASQALEAENQQLVAELSAREAALTAARPTLPPEDFRARADAFNADAERIRTTQEQKSRAILAFSEVEQRRFFDVALPLLNDLVRQVGALVLLDARLVMLAAGGVDITDEAIERIDAALGDGADTVERPLLLDAIGPMTPGGVPLPGLPAPDRAP